MNRTKRLEFTRPTRSVPLQARNATEAVTRLAHVCRERSRLEQEYASLERRIGTIKSRLAAIAGAETRLVPMIQALRAAPPDAAATPAVKDVPPGAVGLTLQY